MTHPITAGPGGNCPPPPPPPPPTKFHVLAPAVTALAGVSITVGLVVATLRPMMVLDGSAYLALIGFGLLVTWLLAGIVRPAPKRRRTA